LGLLVLTIVAVPLATAQHADRDTVTADSATALPTEILPWPQNRLDDFYGDQARRFLDSSQPRPDVLPPFPGLDGGTFGHWGQYPSERSLDASMSEIDFGGLLSTVTMHFRKLTNKALIVQPGEEGSMTALFDPLATTFTDVWEGPLVTFSPAMLGLITPAAPRGKQCINLQASRWDIPKTSAQQYRGLYRNGRHVVFRYQIGQADVLDRSWQISDQFARSLQITGTLPQDSSLTLLETKSAALQLPQPAGLSAVSFSDGADQWTIVLRGDESVKLVIAERQIQLKFANHDLDQPIHLAFLRGDAADSMQSFAQLDIPSPDSLTAGGRSQWSERTVTTTGERGEDEAAFAIDTLTIPAFEKNDFNVPFRVSAFEFVADNRCYVATLYGDIWIVDGIDDQLGNLHWQRVASGLHQPLGLLFQNGNLLVTGRDQITRLHDLNGDQEFDFYECLTNSYSTAPGHEVVTCLRQDEHQNLYFSNAVDGIMKYDPQYHTLETLGNGIRYCNGIDVTPDGQVILATAQEGPWTPATAIFNVGGRSYHGLGGPKKNVGQYGYDLPMCYVPRGVDPSAGEVTWLPDDPRIGPLAGHYVGLSSSNCTHYLVLREEIDGVVQGGVVPLPGQFLSGAHRLKFNPQDGFIYVAGTQSWQSYAAAQGSLQRLRYTGRPLDLPSAVETHENGLILRFNTQLDPVSVKLANVFCEQWNYLYSPAYGSEEYSIRAPGRPGHDEVEVRSVHLLADGRSVFVELPQLHPVMQLHLFMRLRAIGQSPAQNRDFEPDLYYTIHALRPPFTEFSGYERIAKQPFPGFPVIKEYPRDPRLVAQDDLSRTFEFGGGLESRLISAQPGLRFEPNQIRVPPRGRIALTFKNEDISMRHNLTVVTADRLQAIGEASMIMAADPAAIAKHYVPDDPGVIALSPVLNPNDQYTVYFRAPAKSGLYRIVCTFPGHWTVMQAWLIVAGEGEEFELPAEAPQRAFVKMWMTMDLADDAEQLSDRSIENGRQVFASAGCIKCHLIAGQGTKLGPDLTDVSKRFKGAKLLEQILNPSSEIHKDFQTHVFLTDDGQTIAGLVIAEDEDTIQVLPNPLQPDEIKIVHKSTLEDRLPSKLSTMPKGLLMTYTKAEILDLLAFLQTGVATE
jgi:putative heme-binding domain-containing protein